MSDEPPIAARRSHLPRVTLELVLKRLIEERYIRTRELTLLRRQNEELRILLRSALWEYAQSNGTKVPHIFVRHWIEDRRKREV